jgi:benzil reductase ((S)-benzoin forming)
MKIAIVTGASRGLGRSFAEQLLDRGYFVYAVSRSGEGPKALDSRSVQADLSQAGAASMLAQNIYPAILERGPDALLLINNAGTIMPTCRIERAELLALEKSFLLNLSAPTILTAAFLKTFQDVDMPKMILNISSGAAIKNYEGWGHYCAGKSGLDRLTQVVAAEQASTAYPTSIYSVYPGVLDTKMQEQIRETTKEDLPAVDRFLDMYTHDELEKPETVAAKILSFFIQYPSSGVYDIREL